MPHVSTAGGSTGDGRDDFAATDELKVYKDEGEEEQRSSENLTEEKLGLVTETEEGKSSDVDVKNGYSTDDNSTGNSACGKVPEYPIPERLSFGYPLFPPYPYSNGATLVASPGKLFASHPGLGFYMYNNDCITTQPPPAHMGIPPLHIDPKTGLPRHPMYGLPPSPAQLSHQLYQHEFSPLQCFDMLSRSSPTAFCSSYPSPLGSPPLTWFGSSGILPLHPGFPYGGLHHPAVITPGPKQELSPLTESAENCRRQSFLLHQRRFEDAARYHSGRSSSSNAGGSTSPPDTPRSKKTHIKKPLNAFMLFMKEMRQSVIDECTLKESAAINQILGRRWHALDRSEQQKYYDMARKEKELHLQLYPGWSARDNYATHTKKKKRKRESLNDTRSSEGIDEHECPNNRRCRARYGFEQQHLWCSCCRSDVPTIKNEKDAYRGRTIDVEEPSHRLIPDRYSSVVTTDL